MNLVKERVIDGNDFEKLIASGVYNLKNILILLMT